MMSEGPRVLRRVRRSGLRRRGRRSARADLRAAVRVQRIVRRELTRHIVVVIPGDGLEARGEGVEPCGLRGELARRRIGAAHDKGQRLQRRIVELVLVQERVERAPVAVMASSTPGTSY